MKSELLKRLLAKGKGAIKAGQSKMEDLGRNARAAMAGGDEVTGQAFRTGRKGHPWGQSPGGASVNQAGTIDDSLFRGDGPLMGDLSTDVFSMRPMGAMDQLKRKLAMMTPEQKAALMGAGGGLAAGGLGGYLMGDEG
jgi:hypothetical protein